jgi:hypothetical protein
MIIRNSRSSARPAAATSASNSGRLKTWEKYSVWYPPAEWGRWTTTKEGDLSTNGVRLRKIQSFAEAAKRLSRPRQSAAYCNEPLARIRS